MVIKVKKALLVIDMQKVCVGQGHAAYFKYNNSDLIRNVNKAIDAGEYSLVVYIRNVMKKSPLNKLAPFQAYEGTEEAELVEGLHMVSDYIVTKQEGNAFTNPALDVLLKEHRIERVEVTGVDGGGCVALTAMGAIKAGYRVTVNEAAIGTMFDKKRDKYFRKLKEAGAEFIQAKGL